MNKTRSSRFFHSVKLDLHLAFFILLAAGLVDSASAEQLIPPSNNQSSMTQTVLPDSTKEIIKKALSEMRMLKSMDSQKNYELQACGKLISGESDDFLRRRTPSEVWESKLSCGCGDNAFAFIKILEPSGLETLVVDSAQVSIPSRLDGDAGHCVVAVLDKGRGQPDRWILVDTSALKILSEDWNTRAKTFSTNYGVFAIGYCGRLADYPIHNHEELKSFYSKILAALSPQFWNDNIPKLNFKLDKSLFDGHGQLLVPNASTLDEREQQQLDELKIRPTREENVLLVLKVGGSHSD